MTFVPKHLVYPCSPDPAAVLVVGERTENGVILPDQYVTLVDANLAGQIRAVQEKRQAVADKAMESAEDPTGRGLPAKAKAAVAAAGAQLLADLAPLEAEAFRQAKARG